MTIYVSYVYLCEGQRLTPGVLLNHVTPFFFFFFETWSPTEPVAHEHGWAGQASGTHLSLPYSIQPIQYTLVFTWVLRI